MPETDVPTVADVVRRAVALVDHEGSDDIARELQLVYEDDDRPAAGEGESLREELRGTLAGLDPEGDSGAAAVAAAVASFLATQPEGGSDGSATIREATRVEWHGEPPELVRSWLADHGVKD